MGIILFIAILSLALNLYQHVKKVTIQTKLSDMQEVLSDIQRGNGKRRILAVKDEITSDLAYTMNAIIYQYEEEKARFKLERDANKALMTSLSHDLRTPLTTLIGYMDAIDRGLVVGDDAEEYFQIARMKADDLKVYIDVLFEWFKLQSGELEILIEKIEITEQTRQIVSDWIPLFEERGMNFEIDIPDHPVYLQMDQDKYRRIMNNLIQNVMHHSEASKITIKIETSDSELSIAVEDNGIGIDSRDLPYLFDRLHKVDRGRSQKGSGLGLAIVRQLVEMMEGKIEVKSEKGQYTKFIMNFKLSP